MRIQSNDIVLLDVTDTKKVDVHISSNHPTIQIYNPNDSQELFTPDWSKVPLVLEATVYADSTPITDEIGSNFKWSRKIGDTVDVLSSTTNTLTISANELAPPTVMVQYICSITYNEKTSENIITFARTDVGKDGASGNSAPAVRAQYSIDGNSGWTGSLNTSTHKYIRFSYDNGATWTSAIKIAGEDGKSVQIKGVAYAKTTPITGQVIALYSDINTTTQITSATNGDSYLVDGYLCVYNGTNFVCTGQIQGPQGEKGDSYYLFIRYADNVNGGGISSSSTGKSYIGFYRSSVNQVPTDVSSATWNWAKFVGEDAKSITLSANAQVFKIDKANTMTPATITVTAQAVNTTIPSSGWTYSIDGGKTFSTTAPTGVTRSGNVITLTGTSITSNSIVVKASDGIYSDFLTIYKVFDGSDGAPGGKGDSAPIAFLTNENISFAANANGQVAGTTVYCNVVAYTGTTQVTPTVGTILSTELPTGMSIGTITTVSNQVRIPIVIANNATLGSAQNVNGIINIPITSPVSTTLQLTWSKINSGVKGDKGDKGDDGVGIKSTTVSYGVSDSASVRPADNTWQSSIPVVAEGKYLWTRTIIDYTDDTIADTVTYTYSKQGAKGDTGSSGSSVTVNSIQYQEGTSATTAPTGTWSNSVVTVAEGSYLWTKTVFSDGKIAYGVARQGIDGDNGRGITSIVEQYYQSTSATTQAGGSWSATVPTWADGKYIWTRSIIAYTDSTTSTTSPICITGQKGGTGVGVSSVDVWYYQSTSATALSGGSWSTTAPTWSDGKYVWTKTITTYTNSTTDETTAVCITGQKGSTGVGVKSVTEYYLATSSSSGVIISTPGWTTTVQTITLDKKYLWNYEVVTYTNNTTSTTTPVIIGVFGNTGNTGKGIKSVTEYYLATSSSSGVTTSTSGWKDTMQTLTPTNKYLWNYELITYTDNTTATISPVIIGVYGDKGDKGNQGDKGADAYTVILTNESHIFAGNVSSAIAASTTTQVLAYKGSASQSVTIVSVDGKTASTSSTATSIAGLSFACSALSGTSPTITFTCTSSFVSPSGTIPIVLKVDGVTITKMFTYSIAFKGATGAQGSTGTAASLVDITPSALYFKSTTGKDGTFTPDYIYLYPRFQTVTFSKWEYSVNGGTTWVAASGANGLTIGTYNSIANTLRIAKTSTLYTDTVTSISFRCVSSNASVYDTVSIAKIYDVVDLRFEGRNLVLNSNQSVTSDTYRTFVYDMSEDWIGGETYTISIKGSINEGQTFGVWANGSSTRVTTLTYDSSKDIYTSTFVASTSIATQTPKTLHVYNTPSDTAAESSIEWIKLEKGTKLTNWLPAPEDLKSTTFQLYAPKGYLLTNDVPTITLETFAYDGSQQITNATFAWYTWNGEAWIALSGATGTSLVLNKSNVFKSGIYKCDMTYGGKVYTATATVEDKTDIYDSLIHVTSKYSPDNRLYWVLYSTVYSDEGEKDELLGPISTTAPISPTTGSYWYKIDETNYTVTLMKYSGTAWATTTDKQEFVYDWFMLNDTNNIVTLGERSKVKIVTSDNFSRTCSVQCDVLDYELAALTHSNQVLNDPSDPIVSDTEPSNPINGQLWIKTGANGSYTLLVWDASNSKWVISEADSQKKVYVAKPTTYNDGDIWIVAAEYEPDSYIDGVLQTEIIDGVTKVVKHLAGTMLRAQYGSDTYKDSDWVSALTYNKEIDKLKENLNTYNQFFTFDNTGMIMKAKSLNGQISEFSTKLTNNELGFYQGENKVAYINNNQLNISKAEITNGMTIGGTEPTLQIGNFAIIQESNGSLSIGLKS